MRVLLSILPAVFLAGCASGGPIAGKGPGGQPHVPKGTTVIALAVVPAPSPSTSGCQSAVSRDPAYVHPGKAVLWEVIDLCHGSPTEIEIRFTGGDLRQHLRLDKTNGQAGKGKPEFLNVTVGGHAQPKQEAVYEIWLGGEKIADPRIQIP